MVKIKSFFKAESNDFDKIIPRIFLPCFVTSMIVCKLCPILTEKTFFSEAIDNVVAGMMLSLLGSFAIERAITNATRIRCLIVIAAELFASYAFYVLYVI